MSTTVKPPTAMSPDLTKVLAVATPLIMEFAAELAKLPIPEQQRRIAKVLAAMRDEGSVH